MRTLVGLASLPVFVAGIALSAYAQTHTPSERPAAKDKAATESSFSKADANGDGRLSMDEAAKLPAVASKFQDLDADKDGTLSLTEFAAAPVESAK
jgi:hypothetical protein